MSFDFPNSPTNGQVFSPTGGPVYVYTGGVWRMQGSGQVVTAEARNRLVNGAFQISQENARTAAGVTNYYPADQWRSVVNGTGFTPTFYTADIASPGISPAYFYMNGGTTVKASLAATDQLGFLQAIEGKRIADLDWGNAWAVPVVLRFSAWGGPGTFAVGLYNAAADRSYVMPFTLDGVTVPQTFTFAIPGDKAGTWAADNTMGMGLRIYGAVGSTYQTPTTNQWVAGNFAGFTGMTNQLAVASTVIRIARVGLYADPNATGVPPPWQMPDEADELRACMRYWEPGHLNTDVYAQNGVPYGVPVYFKVTKRVSPAVAIVSAFNNAFPATGNADVGPSRTDGYKSWRVASATAAGGWRETFSANARM